MGFKKTAQVTAVTLGSVSTTGFAFAAVQAPTAAALASALGSAGSLVALVVGFHAAAQGNQARRDEAARAQAPAPSPDGGYVEIQPDDQGSVEVPSRADSGIILQLHEPSRIRLPTDDEVLAFGRAYGGPRHGGHERPWPVGRPGSFEARRQSRFGVVLLALAAGAGLLGLGAAAGFVWKLLA